MSSTNRSNSRDTHISDYYITPHKPIKDLFTAMNKLPEFANLFTFDGKFKPYLQFLDCCAGGDNKYPMSYPYVLSQFGVPIGNINSIDIRPDSKANVIDNFLTIKKQNQIPQITITNPPFNLAQEIITKALSEVHPDGFVIMLLRLNFFGSQKRKQFWQDNMPIVTFVHRERISFTNGATDSIEYMHCIWSSKIKQNHTKLIII